MTSNIIQKPRSAGANGENMQQMIEKVQTDLMQLQTHLRDAYGIDPSELNVAVSNTSKILQMAISASPSNQQNRGAEAPAMLPTPPDRPVFLTGRSKKFVHYRPMVKPSDILALASNPESMESRRLLANHWGIQLPVLVPPVEEDEPTADKRKPVTGLVLAKIPYNPKVAAKSMPSGESPLNNGLLFATQRGVIPKSSKISVTPQPVHSLNLMVSSRTDNTTIHESEKTPIKPPGTTSVTFAEVPPNTRQTAITPATNRDTGIPAPPPVSPIGKAHEHRVAIQHGLTRLGPEFERLRERSGADWPNVRCVLDAIEQHLQNYAIPLAFVETEKIPALAAQINAGVAVQKEQVMECIINRQEVEELIRIPGRRYLGRDGKRAAAVTVQSWWRGIIERKRYQAWRAAKLRTALVALHWLMNAKLARVRRLLQQSRADHLQAYRNRLEALATAWPRMKNRRRLIIHLPSLGIAQPVRSSMGALVSRLEHAQQGRLCEIRDPLVDVIYISPVRLSPDDTQYLSKLLGLCNAIKTGSSTDAKPADDRYAIVVPETIGRFRTHSLHNAATLKYSAKGLSRLRALTAGRDAYIVPWSMSWDDLAIAAELGLPILGPEPEVARVYSTKSGAHRLLVASGVEIPPGQADVHTIEQVAEALSRLVAANTEYHVWLLKIDDERNGRGTAVIDLNDFPPAKKLFRERARFGDEWYLGWSQEASAQKLQSELLVKNVLQGLVKPNYPWVYENGATFMETLAKKGGIIEAAAPTGSTSVTVDMLLEPDGNFQIVSSGDQLVLESQRYSRLGATLPQTSIDFSLLNERCRRIAETCRDRGVVGYVSTDFVVLPQPPPSLQALQNFRQRTSSMSIKKEISFSAEEIVYQPDVGQGELTNLWVTGLKLGYSLQMAMMQMFLFLTEGSFDPERHRVESKLVPDLVTRRRLVQPPPKPKQRYAAYAYPLRHSGLKSISRAVFFQLCRAHGIGFDVRERCGTAFLLNDAACREEISMICIADNLPDVVSGAARNLKTLDSELASPKLSGKPPSVLMNAITPISGLPPGLWIDLPDNFASVASELEHILHTVFANEQMQLEQDALREAQLTADLIQKKKDFADLALPDDTDPQY